MKKFLLNLFLFAFNALLIAQLPTIHQHTLIPANPTSASQIKIVTHLETPYSAFGVDKLHAVSVPSQSINLHLCYASGMNPVISHHIDTFAIGQLPAGVYSVELEAYMSSAGQHCARVDSNFASFSFTVSGTSGVDETSLHNEIKIYPNPAQDYLIVESADEEVVRIFSVQGQLLRVPEIDSSGKVSLQGLSAGIYLLEIVAGESRSVRRLVIQ